MYSLSVLYSFRSTFLAYVMITYVFYNPADCGATQLTEKTIDAILASNELVFINFYAEWCRFSNMLMPIFDDAADKVSAEFPEPGRVVMAKVDCDKETAIASRFHITKYPTLKIIRNGQQAKKEYRGQRSAEAFLTYIKKQLEDPVIEFKELRELSDLEADKRIVIGYFDGKEQPEYNLFRRVATNVKDECKFYAGFGEASKTMHPPGQPIVVFRPDRDRSNDLDETYTGGLHPNSFDELHTWVQEKCVPLVREITFENAEELTEEGLPFLILFHAPDDKETIKRFTEIVRTELLSEKQSINFLTADGKKFAHPLHHLGKSESDLPLIAIDSFRHMYVFPEYKDLEIPGKLKSFIQDLYSGKLHREFHYGPEKTETNSIENDANAVQKDESGQVVQKGPTLPPESTFKKLAPSKNRYTLLRDEL